MARLRVRRMLRTFRFTAHLAPKPCAMVDRARSTWLPRRAQLPAAAGVYFFGFAGAAAMPFWLGCAALALGGGAFFGLPLGSFIVSSWIGVQIRAALLDHVRHQVHGSAAAAIRSSDQGRRA